MLNKDYKDILRALLKNEVKFLVVGAYAMGAHGYPRATGDFDIWVEPSLKNSEKIYRSLTEFGAPLRAIKKDTFTQENIIFQIGLAPQRIDILTHIDGVDFQGAYSHKKKIEIENISVPFLSLKDLIKNKQAANRDKDKLDVKYLRRRQ